MIVRSVLLAAGIAAAAAAGGQTTKSGHAKAVKTGSETPDTVATPAPTSTSDPGATSTDPAAAPAPAADADPAKAALRPSFTLDTPIAVLIADPAARAVLDRDLPGMSTDSNLDKFAKVGLRQLQPMTGGQLTDAMLVKVARDLSSLGGPMLAPIAPTAGGTSKRNHDASR